MSTAEYVLLFLFFGTFLPSLAANALALALAAIANTAVNRRLTFGVRGEVDRFRPQAHGFAIFLAGLGLTGGALALLHVTAPNATTTAELVVLVSANIGATFLRFLLFRLWVFRTHSTSAAIKTDLEPSS